MAAKPITIGFSPFALWENVPRAANITRCEIALESSRQAVKPSCSRLGNFHLSGFSLYLLAFCGFKGPMDVMPNVRGIFARPIITARLWGLRLYWPSSYKNHAEGMGCGMKLFHAAGQLFHRRRCKTAAAAASCQRLPCRCPHVWNAG